MGGKKRGLEIFQGQSAVFWGIGFGFIYAGSISSLTALSEGGLLTTTAIGHAISALVMIGIMPICISWVGKPGILQKDHHPQKEDFDNAEQLLEVEGLAQSPRRIDDDIVELLD